MSALGRLVIELSADIVRYASDLGKAVHISERRAQEISKAISVATGAFTALTAAAGALAKSAINDMDALNKMSQRVGVSVEALAGLKYAAALADVSTEALGTGLKKLSVNMLDTQAGTGEAREAFRALGIEVKQADGTLRGSSVVLRDVADRFAAMEDGAGKTALAVKLFGRSGSDLIPLLNQGAAGLDQATKEAERFGLIVSAEAAKAAEDFNDNLTRLSKAAGALGISLASPMLKTLVDVTNQLRDAATAAGGFWNALLNPFVSGIADPGAKVIELEGKLAKLKKLRDELSAPTFANRLNDIVFGDVRGLNLQIKVAEKQLEVLRAMQSIKLERLSVESIHRAKVPAPALPGPGAKKGDGMDLVGRQWAEWMETENKIMSEAAQAASDYVARVRGAEQAVETARMDAWLQFIDREKEREEIQMRLAAGFDDAGNRIQDQLKNQNDLARDLGLTFSSAFEDAAVAGEKLSKVLQGLAQDVARIFFRKTVTEPLGGALTELLKPVTSGIGGFFSGLFKAGGGPVMGRQPYVVGERGPELFVPATSGSVVPNHALGGGGVVVNLNINQAIDVRTFAQFMASSEGRRVIVGSVEHAFNRAGRSSGMASL